MGRPRAFDWDEAARLYAETRNYSEVARRLGVSGFSVRRALSPAIRDRIATYQRENRTWIGACPDCGAPATKTFNYARRKGRCRDCQARRQTTSVRHDTLRCAYCRLWLPDDAFPHKRDAKSRRFRHSVCTACNRTAKRDWRAANLDHERAIDRERKRRKREAAKAAS